MNLVQLFGIRESRQNILNQTRVPFIQLLLAIFLNHLDVEIEVVSSYKLLFLGNEFCGLYGSNLWTGRNFTTYDKYCTIAVLQLIRKNYFFVNNVPF